MRTVALAEIAAVRNGHPDLTGASVKALVNRHSVGSRFGMMSIANFEPGGAHILHRHPRSAQISCLLSGEAHHLTEDGPVPISAGDIVCVRRNEWHGFRNTVRTHALLLSLYSPASDLTEAGYETFAGAENISAALEISIASLGTGLSDRARPRGGLDAPRLRWFSLDEPPVPISVASLDARERFSFERPPKSEAIFFVIDGSGICSTPEGSVSISSGDTAFIPLDEPVQFHAGEVGAKALVAFFLAALAEGIGATVGADLTPR